MTDLNDEQLAKLRRLRAPAGEHEDRNRALNRSLDNLIDTVGMSIGEDETGNESIVRAIYAVALEVRSAAAMIALAIERAAGDKPETADF